MLKNIEPYTQNQITFGVLALNRMFERKALDDALAQDTLSEAYETLNNVALPEHRDILAFIFRNLFAAEKDTQRIRETLDTIDDIDVPDFVNAYRNRDNENYGSYTSGDIEKLATAFFGPSESKTVMDIGCGQGVFLTETAIHEKAGELHGIEIKQEDAIVSRMKMLILNRDMNHIRCEDVFDMDFRDPELPKYDAVFCHMPMKQTLEAKQLLSCGLFDAVKTAKRVSHRSSEWAYIRAMRKMMKKGGKGIAFIRASLLYLESEQEFRKELLESGMLEGVVLLPEGLLLNTGLQIAMLVLSENNDCIKMVNAASYYEKIKYRNMLTDTEKDRILDLCFNGGANLGNGNHSDDYMEVTPETISDNTYSFDPMRYVLDEKVCFTKARKLSEGTREIFRGAQISSDKQKEMSNFGGEAPNGYLLNLANISNGYMDEDLVEVHIDKIEKYKKYMLQDGDVIISARGTKISTAVAENIKDRNIIATGNLIVVRCNDTLEPYYLKAFFDSDDGNLCLSVAQTGSTIFAINPKQLCELQYDALDMEKQKRIAVKEESLINELRESINWVETLRQDISGVYDRFKK